MERMSAKIIIIRDAREILQLELSLLVICIDKS